MIVKRTKSKCDENGIPTGKPAVHYVEKLATGPVGSVAGFTADKAKACEVTPEQFEQVKAFHAGKKNAGEFSAEGEPAKPSPKAVRVEKVNDAPQG